MLLDAAIFIIDVLAIFGLLSVTIRIMRLMIPPLIQEFHELWLELKATTKLFNRTEKKYPTKSSCCIPCSDCIIRRSIRTLPCHKIDEEAN